MTSPHPHVGMWKTADGHIRQELRADGRYDEARGDRVSAYTGSYRVTGNHLEYLDDTGFTATGDVRDGVLYHEHLVLHRERQPWNADALAAIEAIRADAPQPILFTNASVLTLDPLIGDVTGADVLVVGAVLVGIGPGIITAAEDDGAIVVDCAGMTIVPVVADLLALSGHRAVRGDRVATLTPGNGADFAILHDEHATTLALVFDTLLNHPESVAVLVAGGEVVRWDGADVLGPGTAAPAADEQDLNGSFRLGVWVDETGFLHQELTADGRYDETRGGRPHAFRGRFWLDGDRIDYLDDLGFWAFGEFREETLEHAGYVMRRR